MFGVGSGCGFRVRRRRGAVTNGPVEVTSASEGLGAGFDISMIGKRPDS